MNTGSLIGGGFRIARERGGALLIWTLIELALLIATDYATAAIVQSNFEALLAGATPESVQLSSLPQYCLIGLGGLVVGTIIYAATLRVVLHSTEGGPGWLKLGMDEVRLFLILMLFLVIFIIGLLMVGLLLGGLFAGAGERAAENAQLVMVLLGLIAGAFFGTKVSLVAPLSLKRKAYAMDDGWRLTKGHFWALFSAFLVIFLILFATGVAIVLVTEPDYISAISQYGFASPEAELASFQHYQTLTAGDVNATIIVKWVLSAIQGAIGFALLGGVAATAVQQLTTDEEGLSETFS